MDWVLMYDRGPCFGQCPVYTLYVSSGNTGLIQVKGYLMEPGWYQASLGKEDMDKIKSRLDDPAWWTMDLGIEPEMADLPLTSIAYQHASGLKEIQFRSRINHELSSLFQRMNHVVENAIWEPTTLRPKIRQEPTDIIVQLKPDVSLDTLLTHYKAFNLTLKRVISKRQHYYLLAKSPGSGSSNDLIEYLRLDPDVISAAWDKAIEPRKE